MKKALKIIATVSLITLMLTFPVYSANDEGVSFTQMMSHRVNSAYEEALTTFEAYVKLPAGYAGRGGVILGSYGKQSDCVSFEIHEGGDPRLYVTDTAGTVYDFRFTTPNVCTGNWVHVAIVRDAAAQKAYCYVDGELKETITKSGYTAPIKTALPLVVGGDYRSKNEQYFKGSIASVAVYLDMRTPDEIVQDMTAPSKDGVVAYYDFTSSAASGGFEDKGGNGYDIEPVWFTDKAPVTDYAYSFAVVGDTQIVTYNYPDNFHCIYDWIVDNAQAKKMKFVFGLGDITDRDSAAEWNLAMSNISKLDGLVPYSLVRGNHDSKEGFKNNVTISKYGDVIGGSYDGTMLNTYHELIVGETKYLIMCLDYGASDSVLAWASSIIKGCPDYNVIITTHAYLYRDGTTLDSGDVCPPSTSGGENDGDDMWEKLIKRHENIVLVMSGHDPCDDVVVTQTKGVKGNTVTQMLIDPQGVDASTPGGTGMVTMLYFSEDGKTVTVETYSTIQQKYFISSNQFTMTLDTVDDEPDSTEKSTESKNQQTEQITDVTEPVTEQPATDVTEESGCGSTVSVGVIATVGALCACAGSNKKKRKSKRN